MITKIDIRKAVENKRQWVADIYFNDRPYPNIISGRYANKKNCTEAVNLYEETGKVPWGEF